MKKRRNLGHVSFIHALAEQTQTGITEEHIAKWGWRLDEKNRVNWPDWQMRLYRNSDNIYWIKPVHEQLKGYTKFANLPPEEKYALYHPKNIGRQERQNKFYDNIHNENHI